MTMGFVLPLSQLWVFFLCLVCVFLNEYRVELLPRCVFHYPGLTWVRLSEGRVVETKRKQNQNQTKERKEENGNEAKLERSFKATSCIRLYPLSKTSKLLEMSAKLNCKYNCLLGRRMKTMPRDSRPLA